MTDQIGIENYVMHFVFGAVLGFVIGCSIAWWLADAISPYVWVAVLTSTLFFAVLGSILRDRLWKSIANNPLFGFWRNLFS